MEKFNGKKFFCQSSYLEKDWSVWQYDEYKEVKIFKMTDKYRRYLKEKKEKEKNEYLMILRSKLEYQMKKYGKVDEIDYQEFMGYINGDLK